LAKEPRDEEWLLIEWPERESGTDQSSGFSTFAARTTLRELVKRANSLDYRTRLPRAEARVGHWDITKVGAGEVFIITATLCIAAYGFLVGGKKSVFPPPQAPVDWTYAHETSA